jgi:hypothetical protein
MTSPGKNERIFAEHGNELQSVRSRLDAFQQVFHLQLKPQ